MLDKGKRVWKWFDDYNSEDFDLIGQNLEENILVYKGKVGNSNCKLFDIKKGVDFAKSWLINHRFPDREDASF